ncbi:MAG: serine/threonine-protein phosphatase [Firmicutes bacterium]|nr:serine/threonine-protein phosphatase [Bacillota bacterium]MBR4025210.1 serine/threonine-protein phosphatase [Bacillota bacterium]
MLDKTKFRSILRQLAILFLIGLIVIGWITYSSQLFRTETSIKNQQETIASDIAEEVKIAVNEYTASNWLFNFWYEHSDEMLIEYDSANNSGKVTPAKAETFSSRHPGLHIEYATEEELNELNYTDQKVCAEVAYSWILDRLDQIKMAHHVDYLFIVMTEPPYDTQFFAMSAADPGAVRGTNYEEVYPLGVTVEVNESQQRAMANAVKELNHLADAGNYVDYYSYLDNVNGKDIIIGMTYDLSNIENEIRNVTVNNTLASVTGQLILSLICLFMVYRLIISPLKSVQENIRNYRETKDSETVIANLKEINSKNEIGDLKNDVIELAEEIDDYVDKIESISAEKHRIESELDMAKRIQLSMMPSVFPPYPDRNEFEIYASVEPAREVGGDFYDFFLIDKDHLCMVMADVSGKGVPAALFMMGSKIVIKNSAMLMNSPAKILTRANESICENNEQDMFLTVWLGILELSTGKLVAANAGHEYPALMRAGEKFEIIKSKHGFVIGGFEDAIYMDYELQLEPGDKLFLYTDGLPEATNGDNEMLGIDGMLDALNENCESHPEVILNGVKNAVDGFVKEAEQFDDLTMMCIEYKGGCESEE